MNLACIVRGRRCLLLGPHLVVIVVGALPSLDLVAVRQIAIRKVKALTLTLEGNAVVTSVEPLLSRETGEALPNFHTNAVGRI